MKPTKRVVFSPNEKHIILETPNPRIVISNTTVVLAEHAFVFTPQELNEYTQTVIKQALKTAAEKADMKCKKGRNGEYPEHWNINKKSIKNTFEETFKKFEV